MPGGPEEAAEIGRRIEERRQRRTQALDLALASCVRELAAVGKLAEPKTPEWVVQRAQAVGDLASAVAALTVNGPTSIPKVPWTGDTRPLSTAEALRTVESFVGNVDTLSRESFAVLSQAFAVLANSERS